MATDTERIAILESKLDRIEVDIRGITSAQAEAMKREQDAALKARDLNGELARAIELLENHQEWHEKNAERKYKWTDIILAVGMLSVAIITLVRG